MLHANGMKEGSSLEISLKIVEGENGLLLLLALVLESAGVTSLLYLWGGGG